MRLITHYWFTFAATLCLFPLLGARQGVLGFLGAPGGPRGLETVFGALCVWLSLSVNFVIDRAGHSRRTIGGRPSIPVRAWRTHSVYTAPLWGGLVGVLTALAYLALKQWPGGLGDIWQPWPVFVFGLLGAYASYTHLFLDSLTEAGIYTKRNRRVALAHFRYNNGPLNFGVILGSVLVAYYVWVHPSI